MEISKQWDADPCGLCESEREPGTHAFYEEARRHRYTMYAPWLKSLITAEASAPRRRILEIGVGLGSDHFTFASAGNSMVALDLSREHLRHTGRHLEFEGLQTELVYGDAENTDFADESFDMVYAFGVLHHTPQPENAVREIHRVLRPGGVAIITLYHKYSLNLLLFIARNGLLRGSLLRKGWSGFLSEIEYRKNNDSAAPLVKLFSRQQAKKLFSVFKKVDTETHHVCVEPLHRMFPKTRALFEQLGTVFGWYVVVRATK